jgi:hypothetical protein
VRKALTDLQLWVYAVLALLFDCVYLQWATVLPLDMHAHGINTLGYGTVVALNAVEIVLISLPLTAFFHRHNPHLSLVVAALLLGIGMGLYGWLPTYPGYLLGALIWTMGEMLSYPIVPALSLQAPCVGPTRASTAPFVRLPPCWRLCWGACSWNPWDQRCSGVAACLPARSLRVGT